MSSKLLCLWIVFLMLSSVKPQGWSYSGNNGPDNWGSQFPMCREDFQSPIDLDKNLLHSSKLKYLNIPAFYSMPISGALLMQNYTVVFRLRNTKKLPIKFNNKNFFLKDVKFHWATVDGNIIDGSEHSVDGEKSPVEMQIVHEAEDRQDPKYAIISVFLKNVATTQNPKASEALNKLLTRRSPSSNANGPVLADLLPDNWSYYRYVGSLTAPPCVENVLWFVLTEQVDISTTTLQKLQGFRQGAQMYNYRPIQPLNQREVLFYRDTLGMIVSRKRVPAYAFLFLTLTLLIMWLVQHFVGKKQLVKTTKVRKMKELKPRKKSEPEEYDIDDEDSSYTASSEEIERSRSDERFKLSKQRPPPITL